MRLFSIFTLWWMVVGCCHTMTMSIVTAHKELETETIQTPSKKTAKEKDKTKTTRTKTTKTKTTKDADDIQTIMEEKVWQEGTWLDMHEWLECADITDESQYVIRDASSWASVRRIYQTTFTQVKNDKDFHDDFPDEVATQFPSDNNNNNGDDDDNTTTTIDDFQVPVVTKYTKGMGRGNFAAAFIPKGTLVWKSINLAEFRDIQTYRQVLRRIDPLLACEMLHFTCTGKEDRNDEDSPHVICVELAKSAYCNMCVKPEDCNIDFLEHESKGLTNGCKGELYATRDILEGEEIMMPYEAIDYGLEAVGLRGPPCCTKEEGDEEDEEEDDEDDEEVEDDELQEEDEIDDEVLEAMVWESGTWSNMHEWLDCGEIPDDHIFFNAVHDETIWTFYRESYEKIMKDGQSEFPLAAAMTTTMTPFPKDQSSDFEVPVTVRFEKDGSYGTFANDFIPQGTLVWKPTYVAEFPHPMLYRQFLRHLSEEGEDMMACEILWWTYSSSLRRRLEDGEKEDNYGDDDDSRSQQTSLCVELSTSAYTNACSSGTECNVGYSKQGVDDEEKSSRRRGCPSALYAIRDIQKGEEIFVPHGIDEKGFDGGGIGIDGSSCTNKDFLDEEEVIAES